MHAFASHDRCDTISMGRRGTYGRATFGALARLWARRWTTRRDLAQLDPRLLADVGIDPIEAAWEARKPFWKA